MGWAGDQQIRGGLLPRQAPESPLPCPHAMQARRKISQPTSSEGFVYAPPPSPPLARYPLHRYATVTVTVTQRPMEATTRSRSVGCAALGLHPAGGSPQEETLPNAQCAWARYRAIVR